jgi:hypothetical protein
MIPKNTQKKSLTTLVKWVVAAIAFVVILSELSKVPQKDWWSALRLHFLSGDGWNWFLMAGLLIPVNWGIEALKWQRMIRRIEPISFGTAFRAVLGGVTVSLFTPNRTGEFAGRVLVLEPHHRVTASLVTVAQSFSQLLVTLLAGTSALFFFPGETGYRLAPLYVVLLGVCVISIILYFGLGKIADRLSRFRAWNRWQRYVAPLSDYSFRELLFVLLLSLMRYLVFIVQFYLLLRFFGVGVGFSDALSRIALVYLAGLWIPSFAFTEPLTRAGMAVVLFQDVTLQTEEVVFATSVLWMLNLLLPALFGCFTVYRKPAPLAT